jgi:RND superfamily putative drug exporter
MLDLAAHDFPNYTFALAGGAAEEIDAVNVVYDMFPMAVGITVALVVVLVGTAFRSVVIPMRSVLTIASTLSIVYGTVVSVFQYGILDFLHWDGVHSSGALNWIAPIFSFPVLVGLSLECVGGKKKKKK